MKKWSKIIAVLTLALLVQGLAIGTASAQEPQAGLIYNGLTNSETSLSEAANIGRAIGGGLGTIAGGVYGFFVGIPTGPGGAVITGWAGSLAGSTAGAVLGQALGAF
ncbi:MAG: hypothetical protein LBT74_10520 [Acidobacteriota bacterium]|jgi:hypothetical protein|nr:hypothetical protein [Acidobacteriota bacterium]